MLVDQRMEEVNMAEHRMNIVAPTKPPRIEFDSRVNAWYVRFRNAKVARTISPERPGAVCAVDLDSNNRVVGLELIGVKEFSIRKLRDLSPVDTSKVDFDEATFAPAASVQKLVSV